MTDPNLTDFYVRVARIKTARAKGYGFEAPGALGRSYHVRLPSHRRAILTPLLFLMLCGFLLKGTLYHVVGAESYDNRVTALRAGKGIEPVGGWLMQADPATRFIVAQITRGLALIR